MGGSESKPEPAKTSHVSVRRPERPSPPSQPPHSNLPSNQNLHDYTDAARKFLEKQSVKKLAREKNLNLHGKLIKSRVGVNSKSITLTQDSTDKNLYWLSLKYSSKEKCKISVYYCCNQVTNQEGMPTYFTIAPELPAASVIN